MKKPFSRKYQLIFLIFSLFLLLQSASVFAEWQWTCRVLDNSGDIEDDTYTSLVAGADGNIHIGYFDSENYNLEYCEGIGEEWACQTIESTGNVGSNASLVEGADGNIHISHDDSTNDDLRYCEGAAEEWTCQAIDTENNVGGHTSITEGVDGNIHISHEDQTNRDLRYCEGKNTEWTCQTIESDSRVGWYTSIVEGDDGNIHISHRDTINEELRYCEGDTEKTPQQWTCQIIDTTDNPGSWISMAEGSDTNFHISHEEKTNNDLKYCEGKEEEWTCQIIESTNDVGRYSAIMAGTDSNLHISHEDNTKDNLRYCEGAAEEWTCQVIDDAESSGVYSSIAEGIDGNIHVSHQDAENYYLRYCTGFFKTPPYEPPQVTTPAFCGDGSCDLTSRGETAVNCPVDCPAVCGDTACTHTESPQSCALDCVGCGDGKCGVGEDCSNCENDCGVCETQEPLVEPPVDGPVEPDISEPSNGGPNGNGIQEQPIECIVDSDCTNNNPCKIKTCVGTTCHTVPKTDGSSCGFAQECINVVCTQMSIIPTIPEVDPTTQLAVIAAAALVIGTAYIYLHSLV